MQALTLEKRQAFKSHALFGQLPPGDIDVLLSHARLEHYLADSLIFAKGSPERSMHAILRGSVRISTLSPSGKEVALTIIQAGHIIGEIAMLDGGDRTADATAITECDLLVIDYRDFNSILERHNDLCIRLLRILAQRLRQTDRYVEEMLFEQLGSRLATTLLRLAESVVAPSVPLTLRVSQEELGRMIGSTRESVNKQLQAWHRSGLVELGRRLIVVHDLARLQAVT